MAYDALPAQNSRWRVDAQSLAGAVMQQSDTIPCTPDVGRLLDSPTGLGQARVASVGLIQRTVRAVTGRWHWISLPNHSNPTGISSLSQTAALVARPGRSVPGAASTTSAVHLSAEPGAVAAMEGKPSLSKILLGRAYSKSAGKCHKGNACGELGENDQMLEGRAPGTGTSKLDLTKKARRGKLRSGYISWAATTQIRRTTRLLQRRTKNNPGTIGLSPPWARPPLLNAWRSAY